MEVFLEPVTKADPFFVIGAGHVVPLLIVRSDPERVLEMLLPSFNVIARGLSVFTQPLLTLLNGGREPMRVQPVYEVVQLFATEHRGSCSAASRS